MSIYLLETWIIKPEYEEKHEMLWRKFLDYMNQNQEIFKGIKSMTLFKKLTGKDSVTHAQMVEFDSIEDKLALDESVLKDKTCSEFSRNLAKFKDIETTSEIICEPFLEYK